MISNARVLRRSGVSRGAELIKMVKMIESGNKKEVKKRCCKF